MPIAKPLPSEGGAGLNASAVLRAVNALRSAAHELRGEHFDETRAIVRECDDAVDGLLGVLTGLAAAELALPTIEKRSPSPAPTPDPDGFYGEGDKRKPWQHWRSTKGDFCAICGASPPAPVASVVERELGVISFGPTPDAAALTIPREGCRPTEDFVRTLVCEAVREILPELEEWWDREAERLADSDSEVTEAFAEAKAQRDRDLVAIFYAIGNAL